MEIWTKLVAFFSFLLFFLHSSSELSPTFYQIMEVEDEREFDYKVGGEKGPEHWGRIKKEWGACNNGGLQSPIDLSSKKVKIVPELRELKRNYIPCNATLKNRGHDISVYWDGNAGSVEINGVVYILQQTHWHSPSEHSVNGIKYDLELHMVHMSSDPNAKNKIAVLGQLYTIGQPDNFLSKICWEIKGVVNELLERKVGVLNPAEIKFEGGKYYRYFGSLTVPPCTEGVIWTMNTKIATVSKEQVKLLREAVHDYAEFNARPVQPLNNRDILLYQHPKEEL